MTVFGWEALAAERARPAAAGRVAAERGHCSLMAARDREGHDRRSSWRVGSHNAQSHNHNDVGNAICVRDGAPVLVDAGRPTYTAQTFSRAALRDLGHAVGLPQPSDVNGQMQKDGAAFRAKNVVYQSREVSAALMMDIAPAYPGAAGITEWVRRAIGARQAGRAVGRVRAERAHARPVAELMTPCEVAEAERARYGWHAAELAARRTWSSSRGSTPAFNRPQSSASISTIVRLPRHGAIT